MQSAGQDHHVHHRQNYHNEHVRDFHYNFPEDCVLQNSHYPCRILTIGMSRPSECSQGWWRTLITRRPSGVTCIWTAIKNGDDKHGPDLLKVYYVGWCLWILVVLSFPWLPCGNVVRSCPWPSEWSLLKWHPWPPKCTCERACWTRSSEICHVYDVPLMLMVHVSVTTTMSMLFPIIIYICT